MFTPVITVGRAWRSVSTNPSMSRGLATSQFCAPRSKKVRKFTISAKMWYSGIAVTTTSLPSSMPVRKLAICAQLASRFPCVSAAPLESPVVPPVYCRKRRSCGLGSTGASGSDAPSRSASTIVTAPGRRASTGGLGSLLSAASATPAAITRLTGVRAMTSARVGVEPLKITIVSARASLSWCSSSRAV